MNFSSYPLEQYIKINENDIVFPKEIEISLAVCSESCGNIEFIVDGSSQVCQHCGKLMFRVASKTYVIKQNANS